MTPTSGDQTAQAPQQPPETMAIRRRQLLQSGTATAAAVSGGLSATGVVQGLEPTTPRWTQAYGGNRDDRLYGLTRIPGTDGEHLAVERVEREDGFRGLAVWVTATGEQQWYRVLDGLDALQLWDCCRTADVGYLAAGYRGGETPTARLINIAPDGGVRWERSYGASRSLAFSTVVSTPDGRLVVTGGVANGPIYDIGDL